MIQRTGSDTQKMTRPPAKPPENSQTNRHSNRPNKNPREKIFQLTRSISRRILKCMNDTSPPNMMRMVNLKDDQIEILQYILRAASRTALARYASPDCGDSDLATALILTEILTALEKPSASLSPIAPSCPACLMNQPRMYDADTQTWVHSNTGSLMVSRECWDQTEHAQ